MQGLIYFSEFIGKPVGVFFSFHKRGAKNKINSVGTHNLDELHFDFNISVSHNM